MAKIKYTKRGQPYIITSNGRAKFIKLSSKKRITKRSVSNMARRSKGIKHYGKKYGGMMAQVLGAGIYGAVREKASNALMPITSKVPLGNISDEVVLGISAILLKRTLGRKMPIVAKIADAGIVIESARIGEAIVNGQVGLGGSTTSSKTYVYG